MMILLYCPYDVGDVVDAEGISIPFPQRDVHVYDTGTGVTSPILSEKALPNPAPSETHGPDVEEAET
jgi:small-conductance mechanosensitive channel